MAVEDMLSKAPIDWAFGLADHEYYDSKK